MAALNLCQLFKVSEGIVGDWLSCSVLAEIFEIVMVLIGQNNSLIVPIIS